MKLFPWRKPQPVKRPHFVEDYEAHVERLVRDRPFDQAMKDAVGGSFEAIGDVECDAVRWAGLREGASILDFGCGSGRLACALQKSFRRIEYTGIDVVQQLLDYAAGRCPPSYRFVLSQSFDLPVASASIDMVACFSVFTHLQPTECFLYLSEMQRVLKRDGTIVMSFLEFAEPGHWPMFELTVGQTKIQQNNHLNSFLERPVITLFCEKLGLRAETFLACHEAPWQSTGALGQAIAVIRKGDP